jgi:hypothetical protein
VHHAETLGGVQRGQRSFSVVIQKVFHIFKEMSSHLQSRESYAKGDLSNILNYYSDSSHGEMHAE